MSRAAVLLALGLLWPAGAAAQTPESAEPATRAEALDAARAAREQTLGTESRTGLERLFLFVEEKRVVERLNPPEGFYPALGSFTRGSGFGWGVGYRRRPMRNRLLFDVSTAWTHRNYRTAQVIASALPTPGRRLEVTTGVRWDHFTQEDFFGLGPATDRNDRVSFTLKRLDTFAQVVARPFRAFVLRGRAGVHRFDVAGGTDPRFPSVEARFDDRSAPGLADAPTLRYGEAAIGLDSRDQPGNTRSGGLYNVALGVYRDGGSDGFDFNRIDVTATHVIPIFDKKRGIALHAMASRIDPVGVNRVPFFLMPTVGGSDSLRGYREFRFRDAAAVTLNAEYRWEAFSGLDLALFVDAGDVGPTWTSLVGADLRSSWGVGFRFNTNKRVFLRIDVAGGREGTRIWTALGPVFRR